MMALVSSITMDLVKRFNFRKSKGVTLLEDENDKLSPQLLLKRKKWK